MTYTVQLDFSMDEDDIMTDEQVKDVLTEIFDICNISVSNINILDIND